MRKKIIAGNWKMNLLKAEAVLLFDQLSKQCSLDHAVEMIIFPPSIYLDDFVGRAKESCIKVGAQNFYPRESGAFTGEISVSQIHDLGVEYVLIGHSERRQFFAESDGFLKEKINSALRQELGIVFCCGEPFMVREANTQNSYVLAQLDAALGHLTTEQMQKIVIAYEPIWAIGTGKTATSIQAEEMHAEIRNWLRQHFSEAVAQSTSILYGGSCNAENAEELFSKQNIDGGLIGGAALKFDQFLTISENLRHGSH
jgi:triosephosphate isomerase (TIM)